jgi:Major Facilitator Superfamily
VGCWCLLMGEVIRAEHRGKAVGSVQSGWALGWAVAAIVATVLFSVFPSDTAWRALFWVGLLPALLVFFVRRFVDEPQVFTATQGSLKAKGGTPNFLEIFSSWLLRTTILTSILATGAQGGYYAIATWLPHVSADRAQAHRARNGRLSRCDNRRVFHRLLGRCLPCGSDRSSREVHIVRSVLTANRRRLYAASHHRQHDADLRPFHSASSPRASSRGWEHS